MAKPRYRAVVASVVLAFGCPALAAPTPVASGAYGGDLLIALDPATQTVRGYFQSYTGRGQFSCIFYLKGRLRGENASITTYFPATPDDTIRGTLTLRSPRILRIVLPEEHGGCWNVRHFADAADPANFTLDTPRPWTSVAVVKSARAYFFDAPGARVHRKAFVVRGDGLGVRASRGAWLRVDYLGEDKPISGWVRRSDTYPTD